MKEHGDYLVGTEASRIGQERFQNNVDRNRRAYAMGVNMAFGSDAVYCEEGMTRGEQAIGFLDSYLAAGFPNDHILRMATMHAADLLGVNTGRIEAGRNADIIAMPANPLEENHALYEMSFVMKDGRICKEGSVFRWDIPIKLNNPRRKQRRGDMLGQN